MTKDLTKAEDKIMAELCFSRIPWVGPAMARSCVDHFGTVEEVLKAKPRELMQVSGMNRKAMDSIRQAPSPSSYEKEAEWIIRKGIRTWFIGEEDYPARLAMCPDAPVLLFGKGELDLECERMVGIVGTRRMTSYGEAVCKELVAGLAPLAPVIVSGLAYGVDIQAHRSALNQGLSTVAVAAHGLDRIYPMDHGHELHEMLKDGGMISEFPPGTLPERHHFPRRNRIVAGITDCTVLVETPEKGGAMITADIAHSYERDVLAFPGRAGDLCSAGCNKLIKTHKAAMIEGAEDLIHWMNWEKSATKTPRGSHQKQLFREDLTEEEKSIVEKVEEGGRLSLDELVHRANMPVGRLSPILLNLELKGVLSSLPGKIYVMADA